jgi:hypothetical protein
MKETPEEGPAREMPPTPAPTPPWVPSMQDDPFPPGRSSLRLFTTALLSSGASENGWVPQPPPTPPWVPSMQSDPPPPRPPFMEPGPPASPPWPPHSQSLDDAANQGVQEIVNRQRRFIAPTTQQQPTLPLATAAKLYYQNPATDRSDEESKPASQSVQIIAPQEQPDHPQPQFRPGVQDTNVGSETTSTTTEPPPLHRAETAATPIGARGSSASQGKAELTLATSTDPAALYQEMLSRTAVLEKMMAELNGQWPGIGHNNPPEPIETFSFGDDDRQALDQAVAVLKAQPLAPVAPTDARNAATILKAIGERLWTDLVRAGGYSAKQADAFISEAVKSAGTETGKRLVQLPFWWALASTLMALASTVNDWLGSLLHLRIRASGGRRCRRRCRLRHDQNRYAAGPFRF